VRVKNDDDKEKSDDEVERERQGRATKQEKQFDAELMELMQESAQENVSQADISRPVKLIKEKAEVDTHEKEEPSNKKGMRIHLGISKLRFSFRKEDCYVLTSRKQGFD